MARVSRNQRTASRISRREGEGLIGRRTDGSAIQFSREGARANGTRGLAHASTHAHARSQARAHHHKSDLLESSVSERAHTFFPELQHLEWPVVRRSRKARRRRRFDLHIKKCPHVRPRPRPPPPHAPLRSDQKYLPKSEIANAPPLHFIPFEPPSTFGGAGGRPVGRPRAGRRREGI